MVVKHVPQLSIFCKFSPKFWKFSCIEAETGIKEYTCSRFHSWEAGVFYMGIVCSYINQFAVTIDKLNVFFFSKKALQSHVLINVIYVWTLTKYSKVKVKVLHGKTIPDTARKKVDFGSQITFAVADRYMYIIIHLRNECLFFLGSFGNES